MIVFNTTGHRSAKTSRPRLPRRRTPLLSTQDTANLDLMGTVSKRQATLLAGERKEVTGSDPDQLSQNTRDRVVGGDHVTPTLSFVRKTDKIELMLTSATTAHVVLVVKVDLQSLLHDENEI